MVNYFTFVCTFKFYETCDCVQGMAAKINKNQVN